MNNRHIEDLLDSDDEIPSMQAVYKCVNRVQTQLLTWANPFSCKGKDVIVCVTGNPGVPHFYIEFGAELHRITGLPVCVIGHAGHVDIPGTVLPDNSHYNLAGQLEHKVDLLLNHIDKESRLHLIGHSIGAWMLIELLHKHNVLLNRVSTVHLMFPTLQRMADTKNGHFMNNIVRKIQWLLIFLLKLIYMLPDSFRLFLVAVYIWVNSLPSNYSDRILKFLNPEVVQKVLFLAFDEMDTVTQMNVDGLNRIKHMTRVIYSSDDGWAPLHYINDLKSFQPPMQLTQVHLPHAFVMKSSKRVAELVSENIILR